MPSDATTATSPEATLADQAYAALSGRIDGYALEGWRGWLEVRIADDTDAEADLVAHLERPS